MLPLDWSPWSTFCQGPMLWRHAGQLMWLVLCAPLLEEWVLRAGVQEFLLSRPQRAHAGAAPALRHRLLSVLATALLFGAGHAGRGWTTAAMVLPMALLIGLVYLQTRDWFCCACAHMAANAYGWLACQSAFT